MSLHKKTRDTIDALFAAGQQPVKLKTSEGIGILNGRRPIVLVTAAGVKTNAGTYYEQKSETNLPDGGFLQQDARRDGNVETILLRDGRRGITRRFDASGFKFTPLGTAYYRTMRRNYVISVPITITGNRKNGTPYTYKAHMPIEKWGLKQMEMPMHLTHAQRVAFVKAKVLREQDAKGTRVLNEFYDETWEVDETGSWQINEETVGVNPETNKAEAHVILDRRMRAPEPLVSNSILFQHAICDEAFAYVDDNQCAQRQIASILKQDLGGICYKFAEINKKLYGNDVEGVTPRMVMEFCRNNDYGCVLVHNESIITTLPGAPILAFTCHEDHCFFYKDAAVRRALMQRRGEFTMRLQRAQRQTQTPPTSEWLPWKQQIAPGHFWTSDASTVRAWFLENKRSPKVVKKDVVVIRSLIYNLRKNEGGPGVCHIHVLPERSDDIEKWLEALQIDLHYHGEGLPATSLRVLQTLVKRSRERTWLTGEEKAQILEEHDFCCAVCGSKGQLEFDHIARLSESYDEQKFQPLCVECHREKTAQEARMYDGDQLASHFELEVWKRYVESPRPKALTMKLRECKNLIDMEISDVIRCRRSALLYNVHPIPVFCPLDDIKIRTEFVLGDLNFVAMPLSRKAFASFLGYSGPGWQHRVQTEWLLHTGVIKWEHITETLTATAHLPAGLLAEPLETMERAWGENSGNAKLSVNSLIGLWAIDESDMMKIRTSAREDDAPNDCLKSIFEYQGGFVYDFITKTKIVRNASCRPLHDLCMCSEATRVGQMLFAIQMAGAIPYELKTDSVLFKAKKRRPVELDKLTFRDLGTLYTRNYPLARPTVQLTIVSSESKPFRQSPAEEKDLLRGCYESITTVVSESVGSARARDRGCC